MIFKVIILAWLMLCMIISGCSTRQTPAPVSSTHVQPSSTLTPPAESVEEEKNEENLFLPFPPKIQAMDWSDSLRPLLLKMQQEAAVRPKSLLLTSPIKNHTNGHLFTQGTESLFDEMLKNSQKFSLVLPQQRYEARQALQLSDNDTFNSRSKTIGLARYLGAHYVLDTNITGQVDAPVIEMQLLAVNSGEIIWTGSSSLQN